MTPATGPLNGARMATLVTPRRATPAAAPGAGEHRHHPPVPRALWETLVEDLEAAHHHDPAARSRLEVALGYPGVHAIWVYRVAHRMWADPALRLPARLLSQLARAATGVEIHPGATLGRRMFIDHGMGVVIGETAEVGDDVVLFHGSTLGGRSMRHGKRHPTVGNGVVVGAGAKVLGPVVIGDGAQIGANAVVVRDVPAGAIAVGVPAQIRMPARDFDPAVDDPAIFI